MNNWREQYFDKITCKGTIINSGNGNLIVKGEVKSNTPSPTILYWAGNPPNRRTGYSGSSLPYKDPEQAYYKSENIGSVKAVDRKFEFNIDMPNAYYVGLGSLYVPPHIHFKICEPGSNNEFHTLKISNGVPYRTLTYTAPPSKKSRVSPLFYENRGKPSQLPFRSQEQILRDAGYPSHNNMPDNFWGLKPAQ